MTAKEQLLELDAEMYCKNNFSVSLNDEYWSIYDSNNNLRAFSFISEEIAWKSALVNINYDIKHKLEQ
jgi:hypothetical protein